MSNFLIFKAAFNNSATPAIGAYTAEGATAQFNMNASISPDYYLYNTADDTAVQWFVPTAETTDFEFVADILTRNWTNRVTYFIIADSTGTTRLRMWSQYDSWYFENSDSIAGSENPEYIGVINPTTSGGFNVFHQFRVRVRKLTTSSSSVEVYVDGTLKLTATAGAALVTCAKIGFMGGVNTFGPGIDAGIKNAYVYDLSDGDVVNPGVLSGAFNRFISWMKSKFALKSDIPTVNDATLTIQKNGTNVATFTANQSTAATANITVPTAVSELTNDSGYLTSSSNLDASKLTSGTVDIARLPQGALERLVKVANEAARYALTTADVQLGDTVQQLDTGIMYIVTDADHLDSAAGYTEYTAGTAASVPWSGVTGKPTFAAVATSGAYSDLTGTPTIPTVNDATLTIQQNGSTVGTFTANSSSDKTVNISVPTKTSDLNNDSGFITGVTWNDVADKPSFATVATSGSYNDLSNKPTIPSNNNQLTNGAGYITSSGSCNYANSAGNSDTLDGYHEYSFLRNRGATSTSGEETLWAQIGIKEYINALPDGLNDVYGYGETVSLAGTSSRFDIYCSHNSSNGNGLYYRSGWGDDKKAWRCFIDSDNIGSQSVSYANSAGSVAWDNVSGRPTVNNATLTIQKNGSNVATFTSNASSNVTANISVPTKVSELANDSGFLTSHQDLSGYVPRSGGAVMTGLRLGRDIDSSILQISGGSADEKGAYIRFHGKDYGDTPFAGSALIRVINSSNAKIMSLFPNGTWQWDGQPIQYVSDQRLKQQITEIDDKLLDAWEDVDLVQFKYNDAVDAKKDKARLHTGYVVQQIDKACKSHNVDISAYGLYCHEEYPEETEEVEVEQEDGTKTKERKVIREASEHYSLRYTEVYAVECMYLRRCIARLTARIEELEKEQEAGK